MYLLRVVPVYPKDSFRRKFANFHTGIKEIFYLKTPQFPPHKKYEGKIMINIKLGLDNKQMR